MDFAGVNWIAVPVAAVIAFVFGAVYYGILSKPWMRAARIAPEDATMSPVLLGTGFVFEVLLAIGIAGVVGHLGAGNLTLSNGVVSGFFIWLLIVLPTMTINQRYQGFGWDLTVIDGGHWLGVLLIMGAVIGWMGV